MFKQIKILFSLFFSINAALFCAAALLDIERDWLDDFVIQTKKIEIQGFPDAFNPSIIPWGDSYLLSFRSGDYSIASQEPSLLMSFRFREPFTASTNQIALVWLNQNFEVISDPYVLDIVYEQSPVVAPSMQQDPRLIRVGSHVYLIYSNMVEGLCLRMTRRMFVAELFWDGMNFMVSDPECLIQFEGNEEWRWQKNWVPFDYQENLLLGYSINPHRIMQPLLGSGHCKTLFTTMGAIDWDWGVLRGGTPALLIDDDTYLAFFHSSKEMITTQSFGKKMSHYVGGAYTFSASPPFELKSISSKPIVGKNFYEGPVHQTWKPLRVVFFSGYVFNSQYIWLAYGRQDHEIWIAQLDKKKLLESLVEVEAR